MAANGWRRFEERDPEGYRRFKRDADRRRKERDPEAWRQRVRANKERYLQKLGVDGRRAQNRAGSLKKLYGISVADYDRMLAEQNGVCAICKKVSRDGKTLVVDHDHDTGKVRALLCSTCNPGLGFFDHSPELLREAIEYLARHAAEGC